MPLITVRDLRMYFEIPEKARPLHDTYARLSHLRMPVCVCGGRYGGIATPANLEAMRRQIPGGALGAV
jgi:hypothetical protein